MENNTATPEHKWPWRLMPLYIALVVGAYVIGFHDHDFSKDPSEWGALGDYLGGVINPLTSLLALYFLIKTYQAQKDELSETKRALQESAEHQKATAGSQAEQVELEARRLAASEKQIIVQAMSAEISSKFEEIKFYMSEVNRVTSAMNNKWSVTSLQGKVLFSDNEIKSYRSGCIGKTEVLFSDIRKIQAKLSAISSPNDNVQL